MADQATPAAVLVEGSDPSLVAEAAARAIDELLEGMDRSLALEDHGGDEVDLAAVVDACATPAFLADRRVVVVRNIGRFSADDVAPLVSYLQNPLPTTSVVLVAGEGRTPAKLAAAVKAKGRVVSTGVERNQAAGWVHEQAAGSGVTLDRGAEALLIAHFGEDVARTVALLRVLEAAYGTGARLGPDDIEPYLGEPGSVPPWELTDAIDSGDTTRALTLLHRLTEGGDRHPLVVLAVLHRHVANLLRVDGPTVMSEAEAARAIGIPPGRSTFPARKAVKGARQWGSDNIAEAIVLLARAETDLKGASAVPGQAVVEILVARLCRLARGGAARVAKSAR